MTTPFLPRTLSASASRKCTVVAALMATFASAGEPAVASSKTPAAPATVPAKASATELSSALTKAQALDLLHKVDEMKQAQEDVTQKLLIQETQGANEIVREGEVYNRADGALVVVFSNPKTVAGTGYFRVENNLWFYDPKLGKWDRRTDRERFSGTNVRRSDLSAIPLAAEYEASDDGMERMGDLKVRKLVLAAKPGVEVDFPKLKIWVDDQNLERKREAYAQSGKLLRTSYVMKLVKVPSKKLNRTLTLPGEIQMMDEAEKDRKTVMIFKSNTLGAVPPNVFSKAWLESKSR